MATTFTIFTTADVVRQRLEHRPIASLVSSPHPPFPLQALESHSMMASLHSVEFSPLPFHDPLSFSSKDIFPEWYDWYRTARLAGFYSLVNAPWVHTANFIYDFFLGKRVYPLGVITRTVVDMCFFMPLFMSIMLPSQALLAGHSPDVAKKHTEEKIFPLLVGAWTCFIPISIFNFVFIQTKFRVCTLNAGQLGFGVFVSKIANGVSVSEEEEVLEKLGTADNNNKVEEKEEKEEKEEEKEKEEKKNVKKVC